MVRCAMALMVAGLVVTAALPGRCVASTPESPILSPESAGLAFRRVAGDVEPELILAQRVIDREWGPSDDSIYVEIELPGWKSEPFAALLSAAVPGAGQAYVGEGKAWMFAALEAAGWGGWWWYRRDARDLRDQAEGIAGPPDNPSSGWSFERWAGATEDDPGDLAALYAVDRESFFNLIANDARYEAGWESTDARTTFSSLRIRSDVRLRRARAVTTALWLNHLVSAVHALRTARFHNLPLSREVGVRIDGHMGQGGTVAVAVVRRF
ncbi:MAG TPA: hypothetical protein VJY35_09595 [Candidatus Eisenbacteria bacterium]|nr:hypothetical protein [Candidatus Eisenbacteria bacterium]